MHTEVRLLILPSSPCLLERGFRLERSTALSLSTKSLFSLRVHEHMCLLRLLFSSIVEP